MWIHRLAVWLGLPHWYLSTGCLHDTPQGHAYCRNSTGLSGAKQAGRCKHCGARCRCRCHRAEQQRQRQPRLYVPRNPPHGQGRPLR